MDFRKIFKNFLVCCSISFGIFAVFVTTEILENGSLHASKSSHTSLPSLNPGYNHKVKVHLTIRDGKDNKAERISYVFFDRNKIALRKGSPLRANYHTSLSPGTYIVEWGLLKTKTGFSREATFRKKVTIKEKSPWVEIKIEGDELSVS